MRAVERLQLNDILQATGQAPVGSEDSEDILDDDMLLAIQLSADQARVVADYELYACVSLKSALIHASRMLNASPAILIPILSVRSARIVLDTIVALVVRSPMCSRSLEIFSGPKSKYR